MAQLSEKSFCAFCRTPRRVYRKKHMTLTNVVLSLLAAVLLMLILWQGPDPRAIVFFVVNLAIAEAFIQIRWRVSLPCPYCGFDPALYLRDKAAAAAKVKEFLLVRQTKPSSLLSKHDPIKNLMMVQRQRKRHTRDKSLPAPVDLQI
ncbi:MAG: hypothetical protein H6626_06490 [Pseudobdellovibrionaceae bacterium]|nr:hypothetical protein [Bdellovibrionales bacterium]USN48734.1 MAG: hypothetical protein H6626_06490 [Pseudobdellovibrionaceae bacterium]